MNRHGPCGWRLCLKQGSLFSTIYTSVYNNPAVLNYCERAGSGGGRCDHVRGVDGLDGTTRTSVVFMSLPHSTSIVLLLWKVHRHVCECATCATQCVCCVAIVCWLCMTVGLRSVITVAMSGVALANVRALGICLCATRGTKIIWQCSLLNITELDNCRTIAHYRTTERTAVVAVVELEASRSRWVADSAPAKRNIANENQQKDVPLLKSHHLYD